MQPKAFTCAVALVLCAVAACGKDPDRDMAKDISRAAPPPQPTTTAPANTPANAGQPTSAEKEEGRNPQQGQVDPKESKQQKDFQRDGEPAGPSKDAKPSS
jgi:hypothetical protein